MAKTELQILVGQWMASVGLAFALIIGLSAFGAVDAELRTTPRKVSKAPKKVSRQAVLAKKLTHPEVRGYEIR